MSFYLDKGGCEKRKIERQIFDGCPKRPCPPRCKEKPVCIKKDFKCKKPDITCRFVWDCTPRWFF